MKNLCTILVVGACLALLETSLAGAAGGLSADFNNDYSVDDLDLAEWNENYGVGAGADANGSGASDGADFLSWQSQSGSASSAGAGISNPEPATLVVWGALAAVAGLGVALRNRRGRAAAND